MKIYNINIKKILLGALISLVVIIFAMVLFSSSEVIIMSSENYTQILKEIHDNPYDYKNKRIEMIGYVFRASDFSKNQFVIARDMLINESDSRIVGFLCEYKNANRFKNNEWIKCEGIIDVGDYHGTIPIIKIKEISISNVPEQIWVYPPNIKKLQS